MLSKEQKNSPEIFSVSQLNKNAKFTLEKKFNDVWVKGEIRSEERRVGKECER